MPPIPEPITIFAITLGIIGFFHTVRTGIQDIYDDVKSWKRIRMDLDMFKRDLMVQEEIVIMWRDQWMVWDEDEDFYQHLWGQRGSTLIQGMLGQIHAIFERIQSSLKPLITSRLKFGAKLKYVLAKKKDIKSERAELIQQVTMLTNMALRKFSSCHGEPEGPLQQNIQDIGNLHKLVRLAMETYEVSNSLHQACLNGASDLVIDVELDLFNTGIAESRSKAISLSKNTNLLYFTFLAKGQMRSADPFIRIRVQNNPGLAIEQCQRSFPRAFEEIYKRKRTQSGFTTETDAHRFCVQESTSAEQINGSSISLRTLLLDSQKHGDMAANLQPNAIKTKMAFELVEFGLLLLRTAWLEGLCSCAIRYAVHRRTPGPNREQYYLRIGNVQHLEPRQDRTVAGNSWCSPGATNSLLGLQLRDLGIILTEIALESPVLDIQHPATSGNNGPAEIELVFMTGTPPQRHQESLTETLLRVRKATRDLYVRAVEYCLRSSWTRDDVQEAQLKEYYWEVLIP